MSKENTKQDTAWNKAFKKSGVQKAYLDFAIKLAKRAKAGKQGAEFFDKEGYEDLYDLKKAEVKLYNSYLNRDVESYGELTNDELRDINQRLEKSLYNLNPVAYVSVEHAKNVLDDDYKGRRDNKAFDKLFDIYKELAPKKKPKKESMSAASKAAIAGLGLSAVSLYASHISDAESKDGKGSHAEAEEQRSGRKRNTRKIVFAAVTSILSTGFLIDAFLLEGKYTKMVMDGMKSTKSNEPSNHR